MYELPTSIQVNDKIYAIRENGDFRMVLDCFEALNDEQLTKEERIIACLIIFLQDIKHPNEIFDLPDLEEIAKQMMWFFNCGNPEGAKKQNYKLIDWKRDETLICSAINNVAGKEVRLEPYVHWWTFMGYYTAVGESALATVVGIRNKQSKNKKLEKHERQFVNENPQYFNWDRRTVEQKEEDEYLRNIWNSNGGE